jgi:PhoH-like ATPase
MPLPPAPAHSASQLAASALQQVKARVKKAGSAANLRPEPEPAPNATKSRPSAAKSSKPSTLRPLPVRATEQKPTAPKSETAMVSDKRSLSVSKPAAKVAMAKKSPKAASANAKLFVLDTNVLLHDPICLFRFEEHDVFLPMIVLEELDGHKKGLTEVSRNARQTSRHLDALAASMQDGVVPDMAQGLPLNALGHVDAQGRLFFQTMPLSSHLPSALPQGKADNQILAVVHALRELHAPREVVLVSKDINMRVKARALGLLTDDYQNDRTLDDGELLYAGSFALPHDFWDRFGGEIESWQQGGHTHYRVTGDMVRELLVNQFVYFDAPGEPGLQARVIEIRDKSAVLKTIKDYTHPKNAAWGVLARNREQNFALNLLLDPEIDFVSLAGTAGTGKTLMALAAGLTQVLDEKRYSEIIMTRATVSVGEDIGFLPGTEEEKMGPWMGALDDNLEVLAKTDSSAGEWGRAATQDLIRSRIKIKSLNFMRGRTFLSKFVIIDEAQNLTPKQMKTLITRAGPGTKIICMGNLAQIDTPYLTEGSSGMTFAVDRFKGWPHGGHITLARGERSRLADFASEVL